MNPLRRFWQGRAPRERTMLARGAVVLVLMALYFGAWEPLRDSRDAWRARVATANADLAWMRAVAPQIAAQAPAQDGAARDTRSLLARADASAREAGLGGALLRVEPVAQGQVRVHFEDVGFDALMRWLESLSSRHGTRVGELRAQRAAGVGRVDALLSLEESAR
ncbi:type II secretion system protein GspM [Chiayiivirga flava]|uniref:Type II secretion system protein M n=1 Tax=Chiayiivirga flava TaxID=659595 RepID=A0A7W8FZI5_9GAMM|nr:type II secretion system protein M [Chiayiivirga flava]MBB5207234.1 general secretion pathway protein M [Chiayiivirga flava]